MKQIRIGFVCMGAALYRMTCCGLAFGAGWLVYMIAMVMTVYDGVLSMLFQPIMAAISSGVLTAVAWVLGLLLRYPKRNPWNVSVVPACIVGAVSVFLLCFGYSLGLTYSGLDEFNQPFITLDPWVGLGATFGLIFAIANFPLIPIARSVMDYAPSSADANA